MKKFFCLVFVLSIIGCRQDVMFAPSPNHPANTGLEMGASEPLPQPPIVRIVETPPDQIEGIGNSEVVYEIIPGDNPIEIVKCFIDGVEIECDASGGTITVTEPTLGDHVVAIVVEDSEGLQDGSEAEFTIHDRYKREKLDIAVSVEKKADILFVIDNSISMDEEQASVADKISSFIQNLDGIDWRVAITTTHPEKEQFYGDGKILQFPNGHWFLTSDMDPETAREQFVATIKRDEQGSGYERGIRAVYRSIERAFDPKEEVDQQTQQFYRSSAALSVVVISDEDENTRDLRLDIDLPEVEKSNGKNLVALVKNRWSQEKLFQFHSIITRPGDIQCLRPNGTGYAYGKLYDQLSRETGGIIGDICSDDYGSELNLVGQEVVKLSTSYDLNCVPQDLDLDGVIDVDVISFDNHSVPDYTVDGRKVSFNESLDVGNYRFSYFCLNTVSD